MYYCILCSPCNEIENRPCFPSLTKVVRFEGLEEDILCKWKPKERKSSDTLTKQNRV